MVLVAKFEVIVGGGGIDRLSVEWIRALSSS